MSNLQIDSWKSPSGSNDNIRKAQYLRTATDVHNAFTRQDDLPRGDYYGMGDPTFPSVPYRGQIHDSQVPLAGGSMTPTTPKLESDFYRDMANATQSRGLQNYWGGLGYNAALRNYYDSVYEPLAMARSRELVPLPHQDLGKKEKFTDKESFRNSGQIILNPLVILFLLVIILIALDINILQKLNQIENKNKN